MDTTEWLHFHFSLSCIGEGNGNPLQCSCLENPRDGGAWWAAVCGIAQSWTHLLKFSAVFGTLSAYSSKEAWPRTHIDSECWRTLWVDHGGMVQGGSRWHRWCWQSPVFIFFWETTILFSIAIAPFYIPTAGHKGFKFLHVRTDTCYFLGFFFIVAILKGDFYLHFPNA